MLPNARAVEGNPTWARGEDSSCQRHTAADTGGTVAWEQHSWCSSCIHGRHLRMISLETGEGMLGNIWGIPSGQKEGPLGRGSTCVCDPRMGRGAHMHGIFQNLVRNVSFVCTYSEMKLYFIIGQPEYKRQRDR